MDTEEFNKKERINKIKTLRSLVAALKANNEFPQDREARRDYIKRSERNIYRAVSAFPVAIGTIALGVGLSWALKSSGQVSSMRDIDQIYLSSVVLAWAGCVYLSYTWIIRHYDTLRLIKTGEAIIESRNNHGRYSEKEMKDKVGLDEIGLNF